MPRGVASTPTWLASVQISVPTHGNIAQFCHALSVVWIHASREKINIELACAELALETTILLLRALEDAVEERC